MDEFYGGKPAGSSAGKKLVSALLVLAIMAVTAFSAIGIYKLSTEKRTATQPAASEVSGGNAAGSSGTAGGTVNISGYDLDIVPSQVAAKVIPSVVCIQNYQQSQSQLPFAQTLSGEEQLTLAAEGSGIVYTEDGYIITNWHVVTDTDTGKQYDEVDVTLHNGKVYKNAKVIGADQSTDLAVIKVEATDLTPAEFGDSSKMVLGARVIALGNAGGLQWSATQGIISGLARDVYEDTGYSIKCMQTDAAINPGNSGGPLINNQGQVIGINSAKSADTDVEGLGFSIPINEAKTIIDDLTKYGYVKGRVQLGITGYSVNSNGYHGFVIQSINNDSVLKNTNAAVGDLITAIDGTDISGYGDLRSALAKHSVGDEVQLSILRLDNRSGEKTTFTVTCKLAESKN